MTKYGCTTHIQPLQHDLGGGTHVFCSRSTLDQVNMMIVTTHVTNVLVRTGLNQNRTRTEPNPPKRPSEPVQH